MIPFWNAKSIYIGTDSRQFNALRDELDVKHIKYRYKVRNRLGSLTGRDTVRDSTGSAGIPSAQMYEYEILIHKKDSERIK